MKIKLSKFNCIEKYNNKYLVFNSLKNTFTITDIDISLDNITNNINSEFIDKFLKQGILVDENIDEDNLAREKLKSVIERNCLDLTILPTMDCQFRCAYCYEEKRHEFMSMETADSIIKYIKKNGDNKNSIRISWFGGEPLLAKDILHYISKEVIQYCKEKDKPYSASMTTNGYILNLKTFRECLANEVRLFQITIDGDKEAHDKLRFLKNKQGTFEQIISNLTEIKNGISKEEKFIIHIRINFVKETISRFEKIIDYFDNLFGEDKRFVLFLKTVGNYGGTEVKSIENELVENDEFPNINYEEKEIPITKYSSISQGFDLCYAAKKYSYCIMPNGNIKKCTVSLDDKTNSIGYLNNDGEIIFNEEIKKWDFSKINVAIPKCRKCPLYANCFMLGCPYHLIATGINCVKNETFGKELVTYYKSNPESFLSI